MKSFELLQQLLFCLLVIGVRFWDFHGTGCSALRDIMESHAFSALFRVDLIFVIPFINGVIRALFSTVTTINATFRNSISHNIHHLLINFKSNIAFASLEF